MGGQSNIHQPGCHVKLWDVVFCPWYAPCSRERNEQKWDYHYKLPGSTGTDLRKPSFEPNKLSVLALKGEYALNVLKVPKIEIFESLKH